MTLMARTLYICYFGVREPLVQTQVLPYLRELRKGDFTYATQRRGEDQIEISLLTFEPGEEVGEKRRRGEREKEFTEIRDKLAAEGIEWEWLPYHKRPSAIATAWDIFRGAWFVRQKLASDEIDILHGRVHVPTLMTALGRKFSRRKPKLLFDIRGFFPEEYTDAGIWPENGLLYRGAKRVERWLMKEADGFVVLTEKAREILFPADSRTNGNALTDVRASASVGGKAAVGSSKGNAITDVRAFASEHENPQSAIRNPQSQRPVEVIPCCVDMARFASANAESREEIRRELGIGNRYVAVYVGAFGGWYLTEETADFFGALKARTPDAFALILTQSKPKMIEPLLKARGFADSDYFIAKVPSAEIPRYLSAADVAVSFIKKCYSKQASSPTKNAEYLACGLPIIANQGVGDVDRLILDNGVGALLTDFTAAGYTSALDEIERLGNIADRCRETARREFDLETVGGFRYRRLYSKLLG